VSCCVGRRQISKVYDQYTNFVSLEPTLFSLNLHESYRAYNDPSVADSQIEQNMTGIVKGLFSVLVTSGRIPVIRCPNNDGPSRMVAEQLNNMIREHLVSPLRGCVGYSPRKRLHGLSDCVLVTVNSS
jgi:hypothetical protein